jgi:EmrB/QacA subfamily drug resistance transporter
VLEQRHCLASSIDPSYVRAPGGLTAPPYPARPSGGRPTDEFGLPVLSVQVMSTKQRWVLALASVAAFMISMDSLVVMTALSTIRRALGSSIETLEWTVNAYNLTFAVLLVTGAALGDRFGRRRMLVAGLGLFAAGSAACALSPTVGWLIAARAVQGVGGALVLPLALTLLSAAFPPERRGRALGIFIGVVGLGTLVGPFVGGAVVQGLAWQWIFWINVPIGLVAIPLVLGRIEEGFGPNGRLDMGGLVLVTGGALGLVWALVRGSGAGWGSFEVIAALAGGALLLVAFVAWELRASSPMLPMRFFRLRAFSAANAVNLCLYASQFGTLFLLAQYLQVALGYGPLAAGLRLMPWSGLMLIFGPIGGALADRIGERPLAVGGLLMQTIGMGWLALLASPDLAYSQMLPPLIVSGIGLSMAMPATQRSIVGAVAPIEIGKASGAGSTLRWLGAVLGIAILGAVFASSGSLASPPAFTRGVVPALGVAAALALAGAILGLQMPGRRQAAEMTTVRSVAVPEGVVRRS